MSTISRSRKIRCDGARPMCFNCTHRATGRCEYDAVPKRRGPDRMPGSRQRPGKGRDRQSSEKDDTSKADGKPEDETQGRAASSASENEEERAGLPETLSGENVKPGLSQQKRRRSATTSTHSSTPADGDQHIPSTTSQATPVEQTTRTTSAANADPNSDPWITPISHPYHAGPSSESTTFVGTGFEATEGLNVPTDNTTNDPIYSYAMPQGSYVVTSEAPLSTTTEQYVLDISQPNTVQSTFTANDVHVSLDNTGADYGLLSPSALQTARNYPSVSLAPLTSFESSRPSRVRSTSGATALSSSASPEASSAGLSSSADVPSPDLKFMLSSHQPISQYSPVDHGLLQSNPIVVDQKLLGQGQLDLGSFSPEVLQQMQEQLSVGGGLLNLNDASLQAIDSLTSLALQQTQTCHGNLPEVSFTRKFVRIDL